MYYHCDFAYKDERAAENDVMHVDDYVKRNGMSFVREDELAYMAAASLNTNVLCTFTDGKINLEAYAIDGSLPMYREEYIKSVGIKIDFAKDYDCRDFSHDAQCYYYDGNSVVVTMNKPISLVNARRRFVEKTHIASVNVPCEIEYYGSEAVLNFDNRAYCEVRVFGKADTETKGWEKEQNGEYTIFRGKNQKQLVINM